MGMKEKMFVDIMATQPEVTGSCNPLIVKYPDKTTTRFIVDCGLFQEKDYSKYNKEFPFDGKNIDFALITHNHVDHIGRLPLLVKKGFTGPIYASKATYEFMPYALYDSYKVLKDLAKRNHEPQLYSEANVSETCHRLIPCAFKQSIIIDDHITVTFIKNGHLVGAALILVQIKYPGCRDINILFTGDWNNKNMFFTVPKIPEWIRKLPLTIVQESTYGTTNSSETEAMSGTFERNLIDCISSNGTFISMVFSLGRAQEILYILKCMQKNGKLSKEIPIYFDGKLAQQYTRLYKNQDLGIDGKMLDFLPENLIMVGREDREAIIENSDSKVIVTTSGMGTYGPAQIYIPRYITRENCMLHFTGYTAEGTLGEKLRSAKMGETVNIGGLICKKRAKVEYTAEFSAHAKADEMLKFLKQFEDLRMVLVNHGEAETKLKFSERIAEEVNPVNVAILNRDYCFRIGPYGLIRTLPTKFK